MSQLFLIRHGEPETAWGGSDDDPGLSARGWEQAAEAASRLMGAGRLAIVSSPMRRCRETAAPYLTRRGGEATLEPRVSEVASPAGTTDRRVWLLDNFPWRDPNARRLWSECDSALNAWRADVVDYARRCREDVAVFTHFIAINVIVGAALGREETIVYRPAHASITELAVEAEGFRLVRLGAEMSDGDVR